MSTHAFRAALQDNTPFGLCFEPQVGLANHSCNPNAFVMFDSRRMAVVALKTIKEGEQVFISYVDTTQVCVLPSNALCCIALEIERKKY
jgi:hypothetical protein